MASTNGWDTVYAIYFPTVNQAIVDRGSSPASFSQSVVTDDGTTIATGTFGAWQLALGGDGHLVNMSIPITNGSIDFVGTLSQLSAIDVVLNVNLNWVGEGTVQLVTNTDPSTLAISSVDWGSNTIDETLKGIYQQQLEDWLKANVADFDHVFAEMNVSDVVDQDADFNWITPTDVAYAVADNDNGDINDSVFGILTMTNNNTPPTGQQVAPDAIPSNANSGYLIAPELVLANMFFPNISGLFADGTEESDFRISADGLSITNRNRVTFPDQTIDNDKVVTPKVEAGDFTLALSGVDVAIDIIMSFEWSPGIDVTVTHAAPTGSLSVNTEGTFALNVDGSTTSANVSVSTGVLVAEIVGGIAAAVLAAVGGAVIGAVVEGGAAVAESATDGAVQMITMSAEEGAEGSVGNVLQGIGAAAQALEEDTPSAFVNFLGSTYGKVLCAALGAILGAGVVGTISQVVKAVAKGDTPDLSDFGAAALDPLTFPNINSDGFTIEGGGLDDALQIGFNLDFS